MLAVALGVVTVDMAGAPGVVGGTLAGEGAGVVVVPAKGAVALSARAVGSGAPAGRA